MENRLALNFFEYLAKNATHNQSSVKLANKSDFSQLDADFIMKFADNNSTLLDLASGTGLILNKIYDKIYYICAVEVFEGFTKFIQKVDNIRIVNENIFSHNPSETFDLITLFALMHYLNESEAIVIYKKYFRYLNKGGKIIIKNQFGVNEDVTVSGYSQEQKKDYFAQYRHIDKEVSILQKIGYKNIKVFDIYPPECNRWENTHFYAIVGEK